MTRFSLTGRSPEKMRSGLPGVNYGYTFGLKVIHISGHNRHAVNKGSGHDESVRIGARAGHVERGAPLSNSNINRKDTPVERGKTWPSVQARRTAPCFRSRRSMRRIPISSSNIEIARLQRCAPVRRRLQAKLANVRQKLANLQKLERELRFPLRGCDKELRKQDAHCPILQDSAAR